MVVVRPEDVSVGSSPNPGSVQRPAALSPPAAFSSAAWRAAEMKPELYEAGTWGPSGAFDLMSRNGRAWNE